MEIASSASVGASAPQGMPSRAVAASAFARTLAGRLQLDDVLDHDLAAAGVEGRDAALARAIANTTFRHLGTITAALEARLPQGAASLPKPVQAILATGAAQVLFLEAADHAAVDIAVQMTKQQRLGMKFAALVNAVLRGIGRDAARIRSAMAPLRDDVPAWLRERWIAAYGAKTAGAVAVALAEEIALDITVRGDADVWAHKLGGVVLPSGSVRLTHRQPVETLEGYAEGAWWVQDAASAVPARLLGDVAGARVADLCAAPGGKTAQLAAAGARVTAVDRSAARLQVLQGNLARLGLDAGIVAADAATFEAPAFDAILLDAPCTATGTIRRHPDVMWTKSSQDEAKLAALQARLLDRAADLLRPGGRLVFCTCSLQPAEGEDQVTALLARRADLALAPVAVAETGVHGSVTARGEFRALPHQMPGETPRLSGWGGFFAARFVRQ